MPEGTAMSHTAFPDLQRDLSFHPVTTRSPKLLTPAQIDQYNARGYIFPLDVLTPAEVAVHRAYFEAGYPRRDRPLWPVLPNGHRSAPAPRSVA